SGKLVDAEITVVSSEGSKKAKTELEAALVKASQKKPTSMFGIGATITVVGRTEIPELKRKTLDAYLNGKHYMTTGTVRVSDLLTFARKHRTDRIPPILSNIHVHQIPEAIQAPNGNGATPTGNGKVDVSSNGHLPQASKTPPVNR